MPPAFKPAYLIHGDDHGRIAERRARLRELAEQQSGAQGVELFEGDQATPDNVAAALNAMTFAIGRRFIIVDGAERWKDKEMDALEAALAAIAPDTTVTFFAREDGRVKAPKRLHDAVKKAGGDICRRDSRSSPGSCPSGPSRRLASSASTSRRRLRGCSSRTSASASSDCCGSSRSWRSSSTPGRGTNPHRRRHRCSS